jgi:hypothetical protein
MPFKDECGICGRVLYYSYLRRCQRCGKMFCRSCMVPDVSTGDPTKMLCLHCARKIVSPRTVGKYDRLANYLKFRASFTNTVKLSFAKIDGIIGDNLPTSAYRDERWWSNSPNVSHAKAWVKAGWNIQEVNLKEGYVVFKKVKNVKMKTSRREIKKPFTPVPVRPSRRKKPSKTKISKLYGRLKNLERQKTTIPTYRGSFKPKA